MAHDWREDEPVGEYVDKDGNDVWHNKGELNG